MSCIINPSAEARDSIAAWSVATRLPSRQHTLATACRTDFKNQPRSVFLLCVFLRDPTSFVLCRLYHNHPRSTATTGGRETFGCVLATRFANVSVVVCFISGFLCVITSQPSTSVSFFCDHLNQERRKKKNHHVTGEWETEDYRESKCTVLHTHLSEGGGASTARGLATIVHAYNIFFFNPFVNVCKTPHVTGDISFLTPLTKGYLDEK